MIVYFNEIIHKNQRFFFVEIGNNDKSKQEKMRERESDEAKWK